MRILIHSDPVRQRLQMALERMAASLEYIAMVKYNKLPHSPQIQVQIHIPTYHIYI